MTVELALGCSQSPLQLINNMESYRIYLFHGSFRSRGKSDLRAKLTVTEEKPESEVGDGDKSAESAMRVRVPNENGVRQGS